MNEGEVRLEDFLKEVGFGEVRLTVVDNKLFQIPKQRIERPRKYGLRIEIVVEDPIRLKQG